MTYILSQPGTPHQYAVPEQKKSLIIRFIQWATNEDKQHHIAWAGASMTVMAAVFFPLTMSVIFLNGTAFGLIIIAMISLSLIMIINIAAMPTRYTIPFFFLGILLDAGAIIASFLIK